MLIFASEDEEFVALIEGGSMSLTVGQLCFYSRTRHGSGHTHANARNVSIVVDQAPLVLD